jgi:hypothetical protein
MKSYSLIFFLFLLVSCNTDLRKDEPVKLDEDCKPIINKFFNSLLSNNYRRAIDELLADNENIDQKDSNTISLKEKFYAINEGSGNYRGQTLIKKRGLNSDLAVFSYLAKYDKKFYRFVFVFYNNGVRTKIFKFSFDDNAALELEESLKLYL